MTTINDLNKTIEKIHNYIYANDGLNNFEALEELLKVFYIKTYDEQHENRLRNFQSETRLLNDIDLIFRNITNEFPNLFEKGTKINLKTHTLIYIIKELQPFSFAHIKSDLKGHMMQRIIDRSFREARGQFFTPSSVVDFIVKMIDPKPNERGCDPACGTGGFLFEALEFMAQKSKDKDIKQVIGNVDFFDISKSIVKLISMRMMFEFARQTSNVKVQDSIATDIPAVYDFVLTNPPFGSQGRINDKSILCKFSLGHDDKGKLYSSQVPDILFVEKVLSMLKDGGRSAIVLPDGNFENPSLRYFREFLVSHCQIDAIVSLPDGTFIPYGTGVKSSIIFFTKTKSPKKNYSIFFGQINHLGYTFSKHSKVEYTEDGHILEDYSKVLDKYKSKKYDEDNFLVNIQDIIKHDFNFAYHLYSPRINKRIAELTGKNPIKLKDLVSCEVKRWKIDPSENYRYVEISDINARGCEIINCSCMQGNELPSRATYKLKKDQIIVAVAGNAIGSDWNAKAIVTDEYAGSICTNGFIVLNSKVWSPYLLLHFFNTEAFRVQVKKHRYGTAIPTITREDFLNIKVPNYPEQTRNQITHNIERAFNLKAVVKKLLSAEQPVTDGPVEIHHK